MKKEYIAQAGESYFELEIEGTEQELKEVEMEYDSRS